MVRSTRERQHWRENSLYGADDVQSPVGVGRRKTENEHRCFVLEGRRRFPRLRDSCRGSVFGAVLRPTALRGKQVMKSLCLLRTYLYRYMTAIPKQAVERPTSDVPPFSPTYV